MSIARTIDWLDMRRDAVNLFLIGFLILFLELACIRWFSANVVFLQFFTNIVLIACFLGMSCGCLAAHKRWDWLASFPLVALGTFTAARVTIWVYNYWGGLAVDVGHQALPQEVFFGTEYRDPDLAKFALPIEWISALSFAQAPPGVWFLISCAGVAYLLYRGKALSPPRVLTLGVLVACSALPTELQNQ